MSDRLTDAELVERLKLHKELGSTKASEKLGVSRRNFQISVAAAKLRGLTAETVVQDEASKLKSKIKVLEGQIAAIHRANDTAETIRNTIYGLAELTPEPPKWLAAPRKSGAPGVPMTLWSDWHWGEKVSRDEVGGVNEFDRKIAVERLKRLVDNVIDLAVNHMTTPKYPGIVVMLGGDMISGNIHEELRDTNDGYLQQSILEVEEQLIYGLTAMADTFGKVFVPCVVGNHGRMTLKPRNKGRVFESYEWNIYCHLERHFKDDKRIQFMIPSETDAHFSVLGHRFHLTHGDSLGVKGGDGIIGALGPIARGAIKVGRSEAQIGRDFDTLVMGHWHTYIPRGEASPVIVNGTLKGYDEFARTTLRAPYSRPSQALWFVHEGYGITAQWQVFLDKKQKSGDTASWVSWEQRRA